MMVRGFQSVVGIEAREQFYNMTGELPDAIVACVGGGSNSAGFFSGFLVDPVEIYRVEPLGKGVKLGDHAASLMFGTEGIIPAIESSHAVAYAIELAKKMQRESILVCLSGCGDKDMDYVIEQFGMRK